jgi:septation ring formation regulator EzrA
MGDKDYSISINVHARSNFEAVSKKLDAQMQKMDKAIKRVTKTTTANSVAFSKLNTMMTRLAFVAVPAVGLAMRSIFKEGMQFEASIKDLSALTGITGDRLEVLATKAENLSVRCCSRYEAYRF